MSVELVENAEALTNIFGAWPSFHDAEVLHVILDRSGSEGPSLEMQIHVFRMTDEISPNNHYVLKDHTLVTLRFCGAVRLQLSDFNHQNVLWGLEIQRLNADGDEVQRLGVHMPTSFGMEAEFECSSATVVDVQPYEGSS